MQNRINTIQLLGSILFISIFSSCMYTGDWQKVSETQFSDEQSNLIQKEAFEDVMRLYLITNKSDSIVLRTKSEDIDFSKDGKLIDYFIQRLYHTVVHPSNAGVGIAAPQVGILKNIIWVQRFDKQDTPFEVYINPKIIQYSQKTQFCLEGCLSIPERRDTTKDRSFAILLDYYDKNGINHIEMVEAFTAVIFQHEIDHLNGIMYTDHLDQEIKEAELKIKLEKTKKH